MAERYWITGVQLALLQLVDKERTTKLAQEIIDKQFLGNSNDVDKLFYDLKRMKVKK